MADLRDDDKLFVCVARRTGIGTSELPVCLFRNPSGSTRTVRIKKIVYSNSHTVSSQLRLRIYVDPTVTADGTGISEVALDVGSGNTAQAECFQSPTISTNGSQVADLICPGGATAQDSWIDFPDGFQLRANHAILITGISDGTNRIANITTFWEES